MIEVVNKKITINGVEYESIKLANIALGINLYKNKLI